MILHDNPPPPPTRPTSTNNNNEEEEDGNNGTTEESSSSQHRSPARLIFSLRDPVERAWSDFRFNYVGYVAAWGAGASRACVYMCLFYYGGWNRWGCWCCFAAGHRAIACTQSIIHSFDIYGIKQVLQEEGADLSGRGGEQPGGPRGTQNTHHVFVYMCICIRFDIHLPAPHAHRHSSPA